MFRLPMCAAHWEMLSADVQELLAALKRRRATVAYHVGLLLASDVIDAEQPMWATGWSVRNLRKVRQRRATEDAARRQTCARIRADVRDREGPRYGRATAAWREVLESLGHQLDAFALGAAWPLEVALAMIRSGHGTDGFSAPLVAAALDLEDELAGRATGPNHEPWQDAGCDRFAIA